MGDSYRTSQSFFSRCSAVDEFKDVLVSKFGTLSRAWRVLDIDGSGKMDMREFCQDRMSALNRMGYVGNIRTLWHLLDSTNAGSISLEELDPRAAAALEKFRVVSLQHHDSIEHMWKNIFDIERTNAVNLKLFIQGCQALGYEDEMEAEELFHQLLPKSAGQHLALEDLQFLQNWEETKRRKLERRRLGLRWVEFQSVVANLLRYCRHGEARRLFRALIGEGGLGRLTWQELGISKVEWTAYRMQKSMEARRQQTEAILNARAPLGASPRMKHAESHHIERIREKKSAGKFVFNSPLPPGWGPPPDFVPLEPPASRLRRRSMPKVPKPPGFSGRLPPTKGSKGVGLASTVSLGALHGPRRDLQAAVEARLSAAPFGVVMGEVPRESTLRSSFTLRDTQWPPAEGRTRIG
eukprot:s1558_g20.t1